MQNKLNRLGAVISLGIFAILLIVSSKFHAEISNSETMTYIILGLVGLSILLSAYFLPMALEVSLEGINSKMKTFRWQPRDYGILYLLRR